MCACEANAPLLAELRNFDEECLRTGKVKLRYVRQNVDAGFNTTRTKVVGSGKSFGGRDDVCCVFGSRVLVRLI